MPEVMRPEALKVNVPTASTPELFAPFGMFPAKANAYEFAASAVRENVAGSCS